MSSTDRPLDGITVLVTRPRDQGERLCALIETAGGRAVSLPAMVIRTLDSGESRRALREAVSECSDIIFVSRNAVGCALELQAGLTAALAHKRVYAAGAGTRQALADAGVDGVLYTEATRASEALLELPELSAERIRDKRVAIIRGEGGREMLPEALRRHGAAVRLVELYRRDTPDVPPDKIHALWQDTPPDVIVITSTTGLHNLVRLTPPALRPRLFATQLVVISERIAGEAGSSGFTVKPVVAAAASDEALANAVAAAGESI